MIECKNCDFYDNRTCRRFPPTPASFETVNDYGDKYWEFNSMWSNVNENDWCGEFKETVKGGK